MLNSPQTVVFHVYTPLAMWADAATATMQSPFAPFPTQHNKSYAEIHEGCSMKIKAYKLGTKRRSYNEIELLMVEAGGTRNLTVNHIKSTRELQDGGVEYTMDLSNGAEVKVLAYLCRGEAQEHTTPVTDSFDVEHRWKWRLVLRSECQRGCAGPVLHALNKLGKLGKQQSEPPQSNGNPQEFRRLWKDPRYMYLSFDEACSHVDVYSFRLVLAIVEAQTNKLLSTCVSHAVRVVSNNDVQDGAPHIKLVASVPSTWQGWQGVAQPQVQGRQVQSGQESVEEVPQMVQPVDLQLSHQGSPAGQSMVDQMTPDEVVEIVSPPPLEQDHAPAAFAAPVPVVAPPPAGEHQLAAVLVAAAAVARNDVNQTFSSPNIKIEGIQVEDSIYGSGTGNTLNSLPPYDNNNPNMISNGSGSPPHMQNNGMGGLQYHGNGPAIEDPYGPRMSKTGFRYVYTSPPAKDGSSRWHTIVRWKTHGKDCKIAVWSSTTLKQALAVHDAIQLYRQLHGIHNAPGTKYYMPDLDLQKDIELVKQLRRRPVGPNLNNFLRKWSSDIQPALDRVSMPLPPPPAPPSSQFYAAAEYMVGSSGAHHHHYHQHGTGQQQPFSPYGSGEVQAEMISLNGGGRVFQPFTQCQSQQQQHGGFQSPPVYTPQADGYGYGALAPPGDMVRPQPRRLIQPTAMSSSFMQGGYGIHSYAARVPPPATSHPAPVYQHHNSSAVASSAFQATAVHTSPVVSGLITPNPSQGFSYPSVWQAASHVPAPPVYRDPRVSGPAQPVVNQRAPVPPPLDQQQQQHVQQPGAGNATSSAFQQIDSRLQQLLWQLANATK